MDSRRRREQALAGAILGIQAVVLAAFLLWFRSGQTIFAFVRNFLNFTLLRPYIGALFRGAKNTIVLAVGGIDRAHAQSRLTEISAPQRHPRRR